MKKILFTCLSVLISVMAFSQQKAEVIVNTDLGKHQISKHIYGHFSEHLGRCIYYGLWVGENSHVPNVGGVRKDIIDALKLFLIHISEPTRQEAT